MVKNNYLKTTFFLILICLSAAVNAQMITGVWKGKINRQKAEVKIILNGDSLTGTSYYYESPTTYRRYSIKGYFDATTNEAVWWDDQLIEEKSGRYGVSIPGKMPLLSRADFNCPGDGRMMLDGKTGKIEDNDPKGDLHLDKIAEGSFNDEWNEVIDNYLVGANDPELIDKVQNIARTPVKSPVSTIEEEKPVVDIMAALRESIEQTKSKKKPMEKAKGEKKEAVEIAPPARQKKQKVA